METKKRNVENEKEIQKENSMWKTKDVHIFWLGTFKKNDSFDTIAQNGFAMRMFH